MTPRTCSASPARTLATLLAFSIALAPALAAEPAKDWPQFRGPLSSGTSLGNGVLDREPLGLEVVWKRPLGSGYSSISISGERGATMFTDGEHDYLTAFDTATGKELWRYRIAEMYAGHSGSDDGPISTPTIAGGAVYGLGPRGQLFAVGLGDGQEIWSRTLGEDDAAAPHYGFATVPLVVDDLLIVQTGGEGHSISAFDRKTGATRWSTEDDPVNYQSPAILELGGRRQIVAINDKYLMGLEPESGEVLWKHEHGTDALEGFAQPTALGGDRVLVNSLSEVAAVRVSARNGGFEAEELWRSEAFKRSYAIPVFHDGHLFGFSSRFLTCINAESGEVDWKSRPPGGQGLILIDGRLLIVSPEGDLVVASATAGEYSEKARIPVFERGGYTAPSFADGRIYVRNLSEIAAIRVTETPAAMAEAPEMERELLGRFGEMVKKAEASSDPVKAVDDYLAAQESLPIVEDGGIVHFVYRGPVEDIAMVGNLLPFREEAVLDRIAGTEVYFKSFELDPEAVWEYRFSVNFGEDTLDPENPYSVGSFFGPMSELRMPGFGKREFLDVSGDLRGRLDSFQFKSDIRDDERRIQIYVPPGYAGGEERYPLLIVNLANMAISSGSVEKVLDNLIAAKQIAPVLAAFVPGNRDYENPEVAEDHVRMVTEEIIPHIDKHYRTVADPASRGILGAYSGGTMAVYTAVKAPQAFGKVAAQSLFLRAPFEEVLLGAIEAASPASWDGVVEWRRHALVAGNVIDSAAGTRKVYEALEAKGFDVESREVAGAWGWSSLRAELGEILSSFYPPPSGD